MNKNGRVSCDFRGRSRCPHAARSLDFAAEYFLDNNLWLNDSPELFTAMLINGYRSTFNRCFGELCYLSIRYDERFKRLNVTHAQVRRLVVVVVVVVRWGLVS